MADTTESKDNGLSDGEAALLMQHMDTPTKGIWINESCSVDIAEIQKKQAAMKKVRKWGMMCGLGLMLGAEAEAEMARQ